MCCGENMPSQQRIHPVTLNAGLAALIVPRRQVTVAFDRSNESCELEADLDRVIFYCQVQKATVLTRF
jgi:hypothetical protein